MNDIQPSKGDKTRAKLIETTAGLLHRHGYYAVGLNQILAESGTPRGSLYFHFPGGKEELACASLSASAAQAESELKAALEIARGPVEAVNLMCEHTAQAMEASGWQSGCPIATTALEACSESETVRLIVEAHFTAMSGLIARYLERFGISTEKAAELGVLALAAVEGAMLLAKVKRSAEPIRIIYRNLTRLIEDELERNKTSAPTR
jgi:TetR/AcrR family transcriptional repressor of lmrAB and yxaGH operons